ncbi:beta-lactamase/transpeptidase-like protein [Thozetella sp. PMI_491]|nr:beta-lactamase/transpeptidase-like protein [Thozetella sp. PMI_491]
MSHDGLPRASPESVGVQPGAIQGFLDDAVRSGVELNSFMLYRSGKVVAEGWWWPYRADLPHMLHSATKSFLSVAVGLAIHDGHFNLEDRVVSFFPDRVPSDASEYLLAMTVEDLLTQTSGHGSGQSGGEWRSIEGSWIDKFFSTQVEHKPGTTFVYSSATSFMLSAIVSKAVGQPVRDYLETRLFRPLGIKMLAWDIGPEQINPGGNGVSCLSSDFLKLGILHLKEGMWNGQQILPKAWVEKATTSQRGNKYGYQWWTNPAGYFFAGGLFGQTATVFPGHDAVLVTTAAVPRSAVLEALIGRHFPAIFASSEPLAYDSDANIKLGSQLRSLRLLPEFQKTEASARVADVSRERFVAKANEDGIVSFALDFQADRCILHVQDGRGFHRVQIGLQDWLESETSLSGAKLHHGYEHSQLRVMAGGRWTKEDQFEMTIQFHETAWRDTIVVAFVNDFTAASMDRSVNVNSFSTRRPTVWASILVTGKELESLELGANSPKAFSASVSSVGELLDNAATRAVLEEEIPHLLQSTRLDKARPYTLQMLCGHVEGFDEEIMAKIDGRLSKLQL